MAILDDVCASQHGQKAGADQNLKGKLTDNQRQNKYFQDWGMGKVTRVRLFKVDPDNTYVSFSTFFQFEYYYFFKVLLSIIMLESSDITSKVRHLNSILNLI